MAIFKPLPKSQSQRAIIISAFTCSGKTWLGENSSKPGYPNSARPACPVRDLDSAGFSFLDDQTTRNPEFKKYYLKAISKLVGEEVIILVSTHPETRSGLEELGLKYALVFPERDLQQEWCSRLAGRGDAKLAGVFNERWFGFIDDYKSQAGCEQFRLGQGQYLSDIIKDIERYYGVQRQ